MIPNAAYRIPGKVLLARVVVEAISSTGIYLLYYFPLPSFFVLGIPKRTVRERRERCVCASVAVSLLLLLLLCVREKGLSSDERRSFWKGGRERGKWD